MCRISIMPIDLQLSDPSITVVDRAGERLPFSRGIMATSLLATGIDTEEAYRLASTVQEALRHDGPRRLPAEELVVVTDELLRSGPDGDVIADRWMAWRTAKRTGRPLVIVIGGAPGVGKSTFATRLAVRLGITRIVTTDAIREVLRTVVPATVLPELHASTFELTTGPEPGGFAQFDRQCDVVTSAMVSVAQRLSTEHRSLIAEGVHLAPGADDLLVLDPFGVRAGFRAELAAELGITPSWPVEAFTDPYDDVRQSINRLLLSPFLPHKEHIAGFVYDVSDGMLHAVS
jgi:2-phosphoglycerate kinase